MTPAPDTAALRTARLPPQALVDLFEAMWATLERMPWRVRDSAAHAAARSALGDLEEPLRGLLADLEEGRFEPPDPPRESETERLRAQDTLRRFLESGGLPGFGP
ncbi:MAG: hypothetical protein HZA24_11885 [Nitrospirae bacterium]|nr:hypothetical protein [Nitrospirota bacterium]